LQAISSHHPDASLSLRLAQGFGLPDAAELEAIKLPTGETYSYGIKRKSEDVNIHC
jgi:hypothetical protein